MHPATATRLRPDGAASKAWRRALDLIGWIPTHKLSWPQTNAKAQRIVFGHPMPPDSWPAARAPRSTYREARSMGGMFFGGGISGVSGLSYSALTLHLLAAAGSGFGRSEWPGPPHRVDLLMAGADPHGWTIGSD